MAITSGSTALASDFVSSSSGAGDSGKVPKLGAAGTLASGFMGKGYPATSVFNTTPPNSFTDLDLSSVIGANARVVLLKVIFGHSGEDVAFRKNGESGSVVSVTSGVGTFAGNPNTNEIAYFIMVTDANGVLEWKSDSATGTTQIILEAYW